ncbi:MAG TPA: hypothetical protein VFH56_08835 [Acidimicrobiales bacterium]|nr:hypothetical protein [Acidimicrobiales bacterium]
MAMPGQEGVGSDRTAAASSRTGRSRRRSFLMTQVVVLSIAGISSLINFTSHPPTWRLWVSVAFLAAAMALFGLSRTSWASPEVERDVEDLPRTRVISVLDRVSDRLRDRDLERVRGLVDAGEPALALEAIADLVADSEQPLSNDDRAEMLAVAQGFGIGDKIRRKLALPSH